MIEEKFIYNVMIVAMEKSIHELNNIFPFAKIYLNANSELGAMKLNVIIENQKACVYKGQLKEFSFDELKILQRGGFNMITAKINTEQYRPSKREFFELSFADTSQHQPGQA